MSQEHFEKLPLLGQPASGWRRVLHKLWLTILCILNAVFIVVAVIEWRETSASQAADWRLRALPRGIESISDAQLEQVDARDKSKPVPAFDPLSSSEAVPYTAGDMYHAGDAKSMDDLAEISKSEPWVKDWNIVRHHRPHFFWDTVGGLFFTIILWFSLRLWLGWLSR